MSNFIELPVTAPGLRCFNRTTNTHWGKPEVIDALLRIAYEWSLEFKSMNVGHISKRDGSKFPPHLSHRQGVDVDIRPIRKDRKNLPVTIHQTMYDAVETRKLVEVIRQEARVKTILFNDSELVKAGLTRKYAGHDNHLHVRFDY